MTRGLLVRPALMERQDDLIYIMQSMREPHNESRTSIEVDVTALSSTVSILDQWMTRQPRASPTRETLPRGWANSLQRFCQMGRPHYLYVMYYLGVANWCLYLFPQKR